MLPLLGTLAVFIAIAVLVVNAADRERDATGLLAMGVFFAYLVHADTVINAAYLDVGRVEVPKLPFVVLGGVVIAVGAVLFLGATRVLARDGDFRELQTNRLVTSGPYAWLRHPQDIGWGLMLLGVAIAGRSYVGVVLVVVFGLFVERLWRADEKQLERRFGDDFRRYRATTAAVVPATAR